MRLIKAAKLRIDQKTKRMRNIRCVRATGITRRLEMTAIRHGGAPDYRDVAVWARTSLLQIEKYYDQASHDAMMARVMPPRPRAVIVKTKRRKRESAA